MSSCSQTNNMILYEIHSGDRLHIVTKCIFIWVTITVSNIEQKCLLAVYFLPYNVHLHALLQNN